MKLKKLTKKVASGSGWYDDACGAAHALELVGERWALLVMREMMFGPRRFGDLKAALPGISANVLTQRLAGLEKAGIAVKRKLPPPASVQVYGLTDWGLESEPIFQTLGRWAARSPGHDATLPLSPSSLMLSFRTMFHRDRAEGQVMSVGFVFGEEGFLVRVADGQVVASRETAEVMSDADVVLTGTPMAMAGLVYGGAPMADLEAGGALSVAGDRAVAERFATLFVLPPKADA